MFSTTSASHTAPARSPSSSIRNPSPHILVKSTLGSHASQSESLITNLSSILAGGTPTASTSIHTSNTKSTIITNTPTPAANNHPITRTVYAGVIVGSAIGGLGVVLLVVILVVSTKKRGRRRTSSDSTDLGMTGARGLWMWMKNHYHPSRSARTRHTDISPFFLSSSPGTAGATAHGPSSRTTSASERAAKYLRIQGASHGLVQNLHSEPEGGQGRAAVGKYQVRNRTTANPGVADDSESIPLPPGLSQPQPVMGGGGGGVSMEGAGANQMVEDSANHDVHPSSSQAHVSGEESPPSYHFTSVVT
ncbi:hypothetical protein JR316_0010846 [Psilocybe cubensis]|uniref:Mid2 domain-containing protein n=2 Tax=Psilocybe cubensis TaxID=181762 RepID=A0A8H7XXF1_PSICU|nr:hypothetical protein JR316_0010846 [Psilocybe cubensis]KAH9476930.1 hypothetical protein JR316_0010846 [Psilocybe cubensis]